MRDPTATVRGWPLDTIYPDHESFETLFGRYYPIIYGLLFRLTGDPAEAEDPDQETFLRLHYILNGHRAPDNVGGWLYRVATRLGYNALRAVRRRTVREQAVAESEGARTIDPAEEAFHAEGRRWAQQALAGLSPQQVQLLVLRQSGLSYQELAATRGLAPGSVGTLLARAERAFEVKYKALIGDCTGDDE